LSLFKAQASKTCLKLNHSKALSLFAGNPLEIYGFALTSDGRVTGSEIFESEVQIDDIETGKDHPKTKTR